LRGGIEQLKLRLSNKSKEINQMRTYLSRSQRSLSRLRLKHDELAVESDKMQRICDHSHELLSALQDLSARRTELSAEISDLERKNTTNRLLASELQFLESQQSRDGARAAEIAATIEGQTARIEELTNDQLALKSKFANQEDQFREARGTLRDHISRLQSMPQSRVEQLRAESADCDLELRRLKAARKRSDGPLASLRQKKLSAKERIERLK
jgi:chromosome segregation ATPase